MAYNAGEAYLQISPNFAGVAEAIDRKASEWGLSAARRFGDAFNREASHSVHDVTASVRLDSGSVSAQLDRLRAQLDRLGASSPTIRVGVNTRDADLRLAALKAAAADVGRSSPTIGVNVNAGPALAAIAAIRTALLGLSAGAVITPLIGGITSMLGPLAALGGGLTGVGAASLPGLSAVKDAYSAQSAATTAAGKAAGQSASAQVSAANQIRSAELSLADTQRRVANDRVTQAQAMKSAQQGVAQANQQVTAAEQQLTQAQAASLAAQKALTDAREAGRRSLQDQAFAAKDAALQLQQDQLALVQARQNAAVVNSSTTSTDLQRQQAALAVQEAQQALAEQQVTATRATVDNNKAQTAGVAGTPQVVAAHQRIAAAHTATTAAAQQLTQARDAQAQAEQQLANAHRAAVQQQAQDASDLIRAQMAVQQAQIGANSSMSAGTSAARGYAAELAKLTPQERALFDATEKFKTSFSDWGHALEPRTLPLFTGGLSMLTTLLPRLTPLIDATAGALSRIEQSMSRAFNGAGAAKFLDTLTKMAGPALADMAAIGGNLAGVFAHVVEAFAPLSRVVLGGLRTLTGELSKATTSPGLTRFVDTLVRLGPALVGTLGDVGRLIGRVMQALAPLAGPVLSVIDTLAGALTNIVTAVGPSMGRLFADLAPALNSVIRAFSPVIAKLVQTIAPVIGTLLTDLARGLTLAAPALQPIANLVGSVVTAFGPLLPLIGQLIGQLLPPLANLFTQLMRAMQPVVTAFVTALQPVLPVITGALTDLVNAFTPVFPILAQLLISLTPLIPPFAELIVQIAKLAVDLLPILLPLLRLLEPIMQALVGIVRFVVGVFTDLVKMAESAIQWFKGLAQTVSDVTHTVASAWSGAWNAVRNAWNDVRDFLSREWHAFASTASRLWDGIVNGIGSAFSAVGDVASRVWGTVERVFAAGVNFVTQDILNPLIRVLDDVLGVFGVHISSIPALHVGGGGSSGPVRSGTSSGAGGRNRAYAAGGVLPGYTPGVDGIRVPQFFFSGGEGILVPEATRALGGGAGIQAINSMFSSRVSKPGHFAGGGVIGGILGAIGGAVRSGAADVALAALNTAEAPIRALLSIAPAGIGRTLGVGLLAKLNAAVDTFIRGHVATLTATGSLPTGAHFALIRQALGLAGVTDSFANESAVNTIVNYESGWNPRAINLTDSNAQAGHPSQGLMQTIPSTFEAYRLRSLVDNIVDPLANLVAGIRYATANYGSLSNVPGVRGLASGSGYVGYDRGGFLPPGLSAVYNGTGRPEPVFSSSQWAQMQELASRPSGPAAFEGDLYLSTGEFLGAVRGEVHEALGDVVRQVARVR